MAKELKSVETLLKKDYLKINNNADSNLAVNRFNGRGSSDSCWNHLKYAKLVDVEDNSPPGRRQRAQFQGPLIINISTPRSILI